MSGVPKALDETAFVDGYSFPRFFIRVFIPTIAAGIGVACFFCFMFSWVELLLAKTLTAVAAKPIAASSVRPRNRPNRSGRSLSPGAAATITPDKRPFFPKG
jgi:glycerol transport system permease protein